MYNRSVTNLAAISPGALAKADVAVVLTTFNSGAYLQEQLDSLLKQSSPPRWVMVADDGSRDNTLEIIHEFAQRAPCTVEVLNAQDAPLGPCHNFSRALAHACQGGADAVALCDHDDVWHRNKLEIGTALLRQHASTVPLVVTHDLRLTDATGALSSSSFWRYQGFSPRSGKAFSTLLTMNSFPGCSMLVNRAVLDVALPIPPEASMHDWWIVLVAAAIGKVETLPDPLVDYRQHASNAIGAQPHAWWRRAMNGARPDAAGVRRALAVATKQAEALLTRCGHLMPPAHRAAAEAFVSLPHVGPWQRRSILLRHGIRKTGLLRQANLLWNI